MGLPISRSAPSQTDAAGEPAPWSGSLLASPLALVAAVAIATALLHFVTNYGDNTVSVISDATNAVVATIPVGNGPYGVAYDSGKGEVFVVDDLDNNVSVISDATNTVVATVPVGSNPDGAAYDSNKGEVFVANSFDNTVSVIDDTTNAVVATPSVGSAPDGVAYDSGTREVIVTNNFDNTVSVIWDATNAVVATVPVGSGPVIGVAYDPVTGYVYVSNSNQGTVSILSALALSPTNGTVGSTTTATGTGFAASTPIAFTLDGVTATSTCSSAGDGSFSCTVTVPAVPNGQHQLTASDGARNASAMFTVNPSISILYASGTVMSSDTVNGRGFTAGDSITVKIGSTTLTCSDSTIGTNGSFTCDFAVPPLSAGGNPYTVTATDTSSVTSSDTYLGARVTFTVDPSISILYTFGTVMSSDAVYGQGFTAGDLVTVKIGTTTLTCSESIIETDGSFTCDFTVPALTASGNPYTVTATDQHSVSTSDTYLGVLVTFTVDPSLTITGPTSGPVGTSTTVTGSGFSYPETLASVSFNGVTATCVSGGTVGSDGAFSCTFDVPSQPPGSYYVTAADATGTVTSTNQFTVTAPTYTVTFTESGLPSGTSWSVTLAGSTMSSTTSTITFSEPDGTYAYTIADVSGWHQTTLPYTGSVTVSGAAVPEPTLVFTQVTYTVTFSESTLPSGLTWSVTVDGIPASTTTVSGLNTLTWTGLANGTYSYSIMDISGWHQTTLPYSGSLIVNGGTSSISGSGIGYATTLVYSPVMYTVTFTESGLPSGTSWSVTLGGSTESSTTSTIIFSEPNGTYAYTIADVPGWHQTTLPYTGSVTVNGAAVPEPTLAFTQVTYTVTFTESGLPSGTSWSVTVGGSTVPSTTSTITFTEGNGTYAYTIVDVAGWHQPTLPYTGSLTVSGAAVPEPTLVFTQVTYTVTFSESTLPSGLTWTVTVDGIPASTTTVSGLNTLTWTRLANGTYSYSIADISGWHQTTLPYSGSLIVNGGTSSISGSGIGYATTLVYNPVTYTVTFTESGLPSGTSWSVTVGGSTVPSTTTTITFTEPNGTYAYTIVDVPGWHQTTLPYAGSVTVNGAAVPEPTLAFTQVTYTVTFTESGLPSGTSWSVTVGGSTVPSTTSTITFTEGNGTYAYTIVDVAGWHQPTLPYTGSLTVSGAAVPEPTLVFTQVTYTVTFSESTLPSGLTWTVTVDGIPASTTTVSGLNTLTWTRLANGTYSYSIADISGWHQTTLPYSGSLTVNGGTSSISGSGIGYATTLVYNPVTYTVTFTESGLPSGTSWSVTVGGSTVPSTTTTITFTEPNGTFAYAVGSVTGFTVSPLSGSTTVAGTSPPRVSVSFTPIPTSSSSSGLPSWVYAVIGVVIVVVLIGAVTGLTRHRRPPAAAAQPPRPPPS